MIMNILEVYLPRLAFLLVLVCWGRVIKAALDDKKDEKARRCSYNDEPSQRDKENRISQVDAWLKNGLIDKEEYRELKKRYEREGL